MAKTYTFKVVNSCSGGEHHGVRLLVNGVAAGIFPVTKTSIMTEDTSKQDLVEALLKIIINNSGATTMAQIKTAIESASVTL